MSPLCLVFLGIQILSVIRLINILLQANDIETNPGPAVNIMHASFHQGSEIVPSSAHGYHSQIISCVAVLYSFLTSPIEWRRSDLDNILLMGNELYLSAPKLASFSSLHDFPKYLSMCGKYFHVTHIKSYSGTLDDILFKNCETCILCLGNSPVAICKDQDHFFVFDPHSRGTDGLPVPSGFASLGDFSDQFAFHAFVHKLRNNLGISKCEKVSQYQLHVKSVKVNAWYRGSSKQGMRYALSFHTGLSEGKTRQRKEFIVHGSFHQGSEIFPASVRGKQCTAISCVAILYSFFSSPNDWNAADIDAILHAGTDLYVFTHKTTDYLFPKDLPDYIAMNGKYFHMVKRNSLTGTFLSGPHVDEASVYTPLNDALSIALQDGALFLCLDGSMVAVIQCRNLFLFLTLTVEILMAY